MVVINFHKRKIHKGKRNAFIFPLNFFPVFFYIVLALRHMSVNKCESIFLLFFGNIHACQSINALYFNNFLCAHSTRSSRISTFTCWTYYLMMCIKWKRLSIWIKTNDIFFVVGFSLFKQCLFKSYINWKFLPLLLLI